MSDNYLKFTCIEAGTVKIQATGTFTDAQQKNFQYRLNGGDWQDYTLNTDISLAVDDEIEWFSDSNIAMSFSSSIYRNFVCTGLFDISGNIMSLLNFNKNMPSDYCFSRLFGTYNFNSGFLRSAELLELPTNTTLTGCFIGMFYLSDKLINAPVLSSAVLGLYCYKEMFRGCTSLVNAPALPATTLAGNCYDGMFNGCTSLVNAPALPATTLKDYCYQYMFNGCTSLVNAPALPATTLATRCYDSMFNGCTSLVTAPALPATTLKDYCYQYMFTGCASLVNAPALPATTLTTSCYKTMFYNCTSLVTAPALPATTLASYCYENMFNGCTSLVTAPELSATTFSITASSCYLNMFGNCKKLRYIKCLSPATSAASFGALNNTETIDFYAPTQYANDWKNKLASQNVNVYPNVDIDYDKTPIEANTKSATIDISIHNVDYDWDNKQPIDMGQIQDTATFDFSRNVTRTPRELNLTYHTDSKDYPVVLTQLGNTLTTPVSDIKHIYFNDGHEAIKMYKGATLLYEKKDKLAYITGDWVLSTVRQSTKEGYTTYMSNKYKGKDNTWDRARIYFTGPDFTMSYTSYAESNYDFILIGEVDYDNSANTSMPSSVPNSHWTHWTKGKQNANVDANTYTATGLSADLHFIDIAYRKDSSSSSSDDRAYVAFAVIEP